MNTFKTIKIKEWEALQQQITVLTVRNNSLRKDIKWMLKENNRLESLLTKRINYEETVKMLLEVNAEQAKRIKQLEKHVSNFEWDIKPSKKDCQEVLKQFKIYLAYEDAIEDTI